MIGRKKENKILVSNSAHTRPEQDNSKKNCKKIQKIIKPLPSNIFSQNGDEISRKKKKKKNKILVPNSVQTRPVLENSEKNSKKIQKIIKPLPGIISNQNGMR